MPYVPPHMRNPETMKLAAEIDAGKMVVIGLDQWVNINKVRCTKLCTSGILGCVGLVLESPNFICATHILDGFEKDWPAYQHQLSLPLVVMGNVTQATVIISSEISSIMARVNPLKEWLVSQDINTITTLIGNGFIVSKNMRGEWITRLKNINNRNLFSSPANIVVSRSKPYVDNWGKLSDRALDSG